MEILEFCADKLRSRGLGSHGAQFQLRWEKSSGISIEVKEGRVENLNKSTDEGLSIRTLRNGRMGFSCLLNLMNRVEAVGADSRFFGPIGAPSLLFSEISVGGGRA